MTDWIYRDTDDLYHSGRFPRPAARLPAKTYRIGFHTEFGAYLKPRPLGGDALIDFFDPNTDLVLDEISRFWKSNSRFIRMGLPWKRGFLLWGPPGGGKTALCRRVADWMIQQDGVVLVGQDANDIMRGIELVRRHEPSRPILNIMEEIDDIDEDTLKNLLDGTHQHENVVHLGTTNYLEELSDAIKNRPSRFDRVLYIGFPSEELRRNYLTEKCYRLAKDKTELEKWVMVTEGMTLAHIKEVLIAVECMELSFEEAIKRVSGLWSNGINDSSARYAKKMEKVPDAADAFLKAMGTISEVKIVN